MGFFTVIAGEKEKILKKNADFVIVSGSEHIRKNQDVHVNTTSAI